MPELIRQTEIDALLTSLRPAGRGPGRGAASATLYDFRHASVLSPSDLSTLRGRLEALATVLSRLLSAYLSQPLGLAVQSVDVISHQEYARALAKPPVLGVVAFRQGTPPALWELTPGLARAALDCMLGGQGRAGPETSEELPRLSRAVLARLFEELISAWTELWPSLRDVAPRLVEVTCTTPAPEAMGQEERLLQALLDVELAGQAGLLRLCLPLTIVRWLLREERASDHPPPPPLSLPSEGALGDTRVELSVRLDAAPTPLTQVLRLRPGDVLDLRRPASTPFTVHLGGRAKFQALAGASNGRAAAKLLEVVPQAEG
jgi:flagellar motor switch protein FliM